MSYLVERWKVSLLGGLFIWIFARSLFASGLAPEIRSQQVSPEQVRAQLLLK